MWSKPVDRSMGPPSRRISPNPRIPPNPPKMREDAGGTAPIRGALLAPPIATNRHGGFGGDRSATRLQELIVSQQELIVSQQELIVSQQELIVSQQWLIVSQQWLIVKLPVEIANDKKNPVPPSLGKVPWRGHPEAIPSEGSPFQLGVTVD